MLLTIKAVLFDIGNTLVKYDYGLPEEVFQKVLRSLGISRSLVDIKEAFLSAEQEAEEANLPSLMGRIECADFWYRWDTLVLKHLKVEENDELPRMIHAKWLAFVDCTPYPEVSEVLQELKRRGLKIGVISNWYEEEIHCVLEKAELEKGFFDIIVGVDTIKKVKPSPDIFEYAVNKLAVKPEETIFVGDNLEADYYGAEKAGIHALLIDRMEKQPDGLSTIKSLIEILSRID